MPNPLQALGIVDEVLSHLSTHDQRNLRLVNSWFDKVVCEKNGQISIAHELYERNKPQKGYMLYRWWLSWRRSSLVVLPYVLSAFVNVIVATVLVGFVYSLVIVHILTCYAGFNPTKVSFVCDYILAIIEAMCLDPRVYIKRLPSPTGTPCGGFLESKWFAEKKNSIYAIGGPCHPFNIFFNVLFLLSIGWALALLQILLALIQAATIIGIPNVVHHLHIARFYVWPLGYEYYIYRLLPHVEQIPTDPRLQSLYALLRNNKVRVKFCGGEPYLHRGQEALTYKSGEEKIFEELVETSAKKVADIAAKLNNKNGSSCEV